MATGQKERIERCEEKAPQIAMVQRMTETVDALALQRSIFRENRLNCGHCTRFGRAAHQRPPNFLKTVKRGRKSCSLCEEVDLDAPVFKHVLEWHMNGCLFMELVCLTNPLPGCAVCVHLLE